MRNDRFVLGDDAGAELPLIAETLIKVSSDDDDGSMEMLDLCTADGSVGEVGVLADDASETDMSIISI